MADFGVNSTAVSPVGNSVQPTEGVQSFSAVPQVLSAVVGAVGDIFETKRANANEQFLSDFMAQNMAVMDALDQGAGGIRTAAQARTILRNNFTQAITANPSLRKELVQAQSDVLSLFGGNTLISEGNLEEQRYNDRTDQLITSGFLPSTHSPQQREDADVSARLAVAAQERWEEQKRTIDMRLATGNLNESERKRLEQERSDSAVRFIQDSAPAELGALQTKLQAILDGPGSETEKQVAMQDLYLDWRGRATALVGNVDASQYSAYLAPFEMLSETFQQRAVGALSDAEVVRDSERIIQINKNLALQDPTIARISVASTLFNDVVFQQALVGNQGAFSAALKFLAGTASPNNPDGSVAPPGSAGSGPPSPFATDTATKEGMTTYLQMLTRNVTSDNPAQREEATTRMQEFMASISDYEGMVRRNPQSGIAVMNFLASPEFQRAMTANPEAFGDMGEMAEVLKNHYENEVWTMVGREFRNNQVEIISEDTVELPGMSFGIMGGVSNPPSTQRNTMEFGDTTSLVGARATSGGMEFFPLVTEGEGAVEARAEARRLNKELAPVINTTVKAAAHMQGNTNYREVWEQNAQSILGGGMAAEDDGDGVSLNLRDFNRAPNALTESLSSGGFVGTGDFSDATTPAEVAANFVGFREGEQRDVLSSFIRNAAGINIDPATTAWCAAFVNAALGAKGMEGTGTMVAKDFMRWGEAVERPAQGDIVVFDRGAPGSWQGHVGFYVGPSNREGYIRVLGGNQDDSVSIRDYPIDRLEGYRRPPAPPRDTPSNGTRRYGTQREAEAAFDRGDISAGDLVYVNGQATRVSADGDVQ